MIATSRRVLQPVPAGILPADLDSEIARVIREVDFIENEALAHYVPCRLRPSQINPPVLAHTGQRLNVLLGKVMNFDKNIAPFGTEPAGSAICRTSAQADRSHRSILRFTHIRDRFEFRPGSGPRRDTLFTQFPRTQLQRNPARRFLAEISWIHGDGLRLGESPTKNRPGALRSITQRTRVAGTRLCIAFRLYRPPCICLLYTRYGRCHRYLSSHPTPRKSAKPRRG